MKQIIVVLSIFLLLFSSCLTDFDGGLSRSSERHPVFEGCVTNWPEDTYFRLTWSDSGNSELNIDSEPITDAQIILSDDSGQIDTLVYLNYIDTLEYDTDTTNIQGFGSTYSEYILRMDGGYYKSTLRGAIGHTYTVKVIITGKEYTASDYMPPITTLDSAKIVSKPIEGKDDGMQLYVPAIYFKEPRQTVDYYLITSSMKFIWNIQSSSSGWAFSPLSDEFLQEQINGLLVNRLFNYKVSDNSPSSTKQVNLFSLSKEAFLYFKEAENMLYGDGGAFTPTPSMIPTNFSNGMLGFFHASSVSRCHTK